ncbi:hypothetical protein QR680_019389 [Steinernema hermaphroditum]|uniref:DDE-1 domain-containing protein n=1 Tax=Steinernema hermaphroditum TaxID=289476 RepID=A0AA39GNI4_9BILA|nr:hypothetical protein QR680_019389 [Steinernema hermaphroditum]
MDIFDDVVVSFGEIFESAPSDSQTPTRFSVFIENYLKIFGEKRESVTHTATRTCFDDDQEQRQASISHFRTLARTCLADPDRYSKICNTDQSGIQLELRGRRTLALKGTKQIQVIVQRENALTHSLTIQPAISASGEFQLPLLVCFQERKAPKKFQEELREFSHLHCVHSTSGMMSSELMMDFLREVFLPNGGDHSVLFVDCWNGYEKGKNQFRQNIEFVTFPKKRPVNCSRWTCFATARSRHFTAD